MQAFYFDSVDSTNDAAKRHIREGKITGPAYILAREQTAGRGTRGRKWSSPKGAGIYLSVIEIPLSQRSMVDDMSASWSGFARQPESGHDVGTSNNPCGIALPCRQSALDAQRQGFTTDNLSLTPGVKDQQSLDPTIFTLAAGVACVECLREHVGLAVQLKPVNDLYVNGAKLGGILTEAVIEKHRIAALITGIGINIAPANHAIEPTAACAVALSEAIDAQTMAALNVESLAADLAQNVHAMNLAVLQGRSDQIRWAWEKHRIPNANLSKPRP